MQPGGAVVRYSIPMPEDSPIGGKDTEEVVPRRPGTVYRQVWWAKADGRQNRLRDVVGGSVILGTAIITGSSSLFGWT